MHRRVAILAVSSALLAAATFGTANAQVRASEPGTVSQTVDGTTLTVVYSRPVARGRSPLFGGVVRWDQVWTPGANWATTLEVDKDVHLNGVLVPKGKYSVWIVPRENADWSVYLNENDRLFHTQRPDSAAA